jgi:hypothetical protein
MSEKIEVGDLVVVWRLTPCCGKGAERVGQIFLVRSFTTAANCCHFCGRSRTELLARGPDGFRPIRLSRLKRIPPLADLDREDRREEIPAT